MDYDKLGRLQKLHSLLQNGAITDEEYQNEKKLILDETPVGDTSKPSGEPIHSELPGTVDPQNKDGNPGMKETAIIFGMNDRTWCILMHLSMLFGVFYLPGFIVPVAMWLLSKDKSAYTNIQGKILMNWMLSYFLYMTCAAVLLFVLIGFVLIPVLILLNVIFSIMGAVNAGESKIRAYPLSISFFKIDPVTYTP